jgi:uncharacterized protein (DUF1697 family)
MKANRYIAFLRGVNIGGHQQVRMADLRRLVESLGHTEVTTYINSGNVVFTNSAHHLDQAGLAAGIEERIRSEWSHQIAVLVRSSRELADILVANPFPDATPTRLLVMFLREPPTRGAIASASEIESGDDEFQVVGATAYVHCPHGVGRSKLADKLSQRLLVTGTARNLATVRKLLDLAR